MSYLLSIDPDSKKSGWALFSGSKLVGYGVATMSELVTMIMDRAGPSLHVVIEGQQIYPHMPVPAKHIIHIAHIAGMIAGMATIVGSRAYIHATPSEWIGRGPLKNKVNRHKLIRKHFAGKVSAVDSYTKEQQSEILDALGIGAWALGGLGVQSLMIKEFMREYER